MIIAMCFNSLPGRRRGIVPRKQASYPGTEPEQWLPAFDEESLYASTIAYGSTAEGRESLMLAIEEAGFDVSIAQDYPFVDATVVYRFCDRSAGRCP